MDSVGHENIKQLFKYVYLLAKKIDEQTCKLTKFDDLFAFEILQKRKKLRYKCVQLIFLDYENYGKKAREILWRQGCYNAISTAKKQKSKLTKVEINEIKEFLCDVINLFKLTASKVEKHFKLDLKHLINLNLVETIEPFDDQQIVDEFEYGIKISLESIDYAIKTIHFLLISLGDSHRYLNDFNVIEPDGRNHNKTTFEIAANYYQEAFKLNPTIGMAQNQLGTLYESKNYDLNSIFHYLFSLQCKYPFVSSEDNLLKIFLKNIEYIEKSEGLQSPDNLKDFISKFILIIDIFFYDKNIIDLNNLCHYNFIEFKRNIQQLNNEKLLFKFVTIILFTIRNLKIRQTSKISNLNALLLAITSEIIDLCLANIEKFIKINEDSNKMFALRYDRIYDMFDKMVVDSKNKTRGNRIKSGSMNKKAIVNSSKSNSEIDVVDIHSDEHKSLENKKKIPAKYRRRRKRVNLRSSSDESENSSCEEMISDFESDNDEKLNGYSDDSELSEDSFSSDDENDDDNDEKFIAPKTSINYGDYNSDDDVIIEGEVLVMCGKDDEIIIVEEQLSIDSNDLNNELMAPFYEKLKFLPKYSKIDPSIILNFAKTDQTLRTLKILFDWLRNNNDILINCYQTNPEFVHKLIKLVNYLNIDIFTRKVYYNLNLLKFDNIRSDNLISLFDQRQAIPLLEDVMLKGFDLFETNQSLLDWEITSRMEITPNEEILILVLKLVDFGFFITKSNKFNYVFCKKSRNFIEGESKRRRRFLNGRQKKHQQRNYGGVNGYMSGNKQKNSYRKYRYDNGQPKDEAIISNGKTILFQKSDNYNSGKTESNQNSASSNTKSDCSDDVKTIIVKHGNIGAKRNGSGSSDERNIHNNKAVEKTEVMARLWLRNEVQTLESKVTKPHSLLLTPYLVLDAKCLTQYTHIVKNLVRTKKFVLLIPTIVFSELDDLKKHSDGARNAIRWLEQEFRKGNRHLRAQRNDENHPITSIKINQNKKLDRESATFLNIIQFCNFIVKDHSTNDVLTLLTGDNIGDKSNYHFTFVQLVDHISIKHEIISTFYAKYKKK